MQAILIVPVDACSPTPWAGPSASCPPADLNTLASFPLMVLALKRGDLRLAVARMLLWALTMGVAATLLSYARPAQTGALFLRGDSYRVRCSRG